MTTPSDKTLIEAVLAGDKAAYEKLYDCYAPLVRAVCYDYTGNLADAQDLAQDVFMRAYEKLNRLRKRDSFGKWLVGIARHRCQEWLRRKSRNQNNNVKLNDVKAAAPETADDSRIELLREMITTLPEKERLALHTFYLQGNSANDVRRIMGLSRSGFYLVLERARKRLERLILKEQENIR
ncbi:MAG: sigma-70 family RNA polymerase sigma factor [Planctomycetes bacterium]|nr:sigma-70 family RNA polymerase sigma factor [Planctomycetota bacterium]